MKVKKYVAPTMPEAMKQIRAELGHDAVILNSKMITKGGFLGLFKKQQIEVIAAIDETPVLKEMPKVKEKPIVSPPKTATSFPVNPENKQQPAIKVEASQQQLSKELEELKMLVKNLSQLQQSEIPLPATIQDWQNRLMNQEVEKEYRNELLAKLLKRYYADGSSADTSEIKKWLQEQLNEDLSKFSFGGIQFNKKYVNLVGPTGVGKTTTLAKIAAECSLKYGKKVALITTDTYRIAAIEQLKTYAKILNTPLEVCYNMEDYQKACERFEEYDIVLIDTAGRNFRNRQYVEDLKKVVQYDREMETYLVLSLTAKLKDMMEIYEQFSLISIDKYIFTKADETSTYGSMLQMITNYQIGVAYITNGQNVPDDMISATRDTVTNLILGVE